MARPTVDIQGIVQVGTLDADVVNAQKQTFGGGFGVDASGNLTANSVSVGPNTPTAVTGGADYNGAVRISSGKPWFDVTHPSFAGGAKLDGVTDDGPSARAVVAAIPTNGGRVIVPPGNMLINSADASNNGLTFTAHGSQLLCSGRATTVITIGVSGLTWGIVAMAAETEFSDFQLNIPAATAPFWGVGASAQAGISNGAGRITNVIVAYGVTTTIPTPAGGVSTSGPAAFAIGPDSPGVGNADLALWQVSGCNTSGPTAPLSTNSCAYLVGNGTGGNILGHSFENCYGDHHGYGIQLAGSGCKWRDGGFTAMKTADIYVRASGGESIFFGGLRGENGTMALTAASVGGLPYGTTLEDCIFNIYTPVVTAGRMILWNNDGPLTLLGGHHDTIGGNTNFGLKTFGGNPIVFTAIGVNTDVDNPYPAAAAAAICVIIAPTVGNGVATTAGNRIDSKMTFGGAVGVTGLTTLSGGVIIQGQGPSATIQIGGTTNLSYFNFGANEDMYLRPGKAAGVIHMDQGAGITMAPDVTMTRQAAFWGHAAVASQPVAPTLLADVIAIIRGCGLSA